MNGAGETRIEKTRPFYLYNNTRQPLFLKIPQDFKEIKNRGRDRSGISRVTLPEPPMN